MRAKIGLVWLLFTFGFLVLIIVTDFPAWLLVIWIAVTLGGATQASSKSQAS